MPPVLSSQSPGQAAARRSPVPDDRRPPQFEFFNGLGGFVDGGRIRDRPQRAVDARALINVVANPAWLRSPSAGPPHVVAQQPGIPADAVSTDLVSDPR